MQSLLEAYKKEGYSALVCLEKECFLQDKQLINNLVKLAIENDDEELFTLLLHKIWWGGYYQTLFAAEASKGNTKYLEKLILVSGSMLLDHVDAEDELYSYADFSLLLIAYNRTKYKYLLHSGGYSSEKFVRALQNL